MTEPTIDALDVVGPPIAESAGVMRAPEPTIQQFDPPPSGRPVQPAQPE